MSLEWYLNELQAPCNVPRLVLNQFKAPTNVPRLFFKRITGY